MSIPEIGRCANCGKSILKKDGSWTHAASRLKHCSDALRSSVSSPVIPPKLNTTNNSGEVK